VWLAPTAFIAYRIGREWCRALVGRLSSTATSGCGSRIKIDECAPSGNYRPLTDDPAVTLIAIAD
jgi:hypothetical protein